MERIRKIDIHAHATAFPAFFPPCRGGRRFIAPEEVLAYYDKLHIEKGMLLPLSSPEGQITPMTSEACKYIADRYPDRFFWYCNVDPRAQYNDLRTDFVSILSFYKSLGARGVGEVTAQLYVDDPLTDRLFTACAACDMPVLIHLAPRFGGGYGLVDDAGLPRLEKMLRRHPDLKLIGHSQPFWQEISSVHDAPLPGKYPAGKVKPGRLVELMREYGNLYCDLSAQSGANAMMRDADFCAAFVSEFADRLLYGCDICAVGNTHPFPFADFLERMVESGKISCENYRRIVRENAIRLFGLT